MYHQDGARSNTLAHDLSNTEQVPYPNGASFSPPVRAAFDRLIGTVQELISLTENVYPSWLLRSYKRELYEAARAVRMMAQHKESLHRGISEELGLIPENAGAILGNTSGRFRSAGRRARRLMHRRRRYRRSTSRRRVALRS